MTRVQSCRREVAVFLEPSDTAAGDLMAYLFIALQLLASLAVRLLFHRRAYPWKGMNFVPVPNHSVRNKVLLYSKWDVAIYVYVDEHGIIEYVATAGT